MWRQQPQLEVLLLHRSAFGESFAGDWAWTTPGGARQADERAAVTAARELFEETGLRLRCIPVESRIAAAQPDRLGHCSAVSPEPNVKRNSRSGPRGRSWSSFGGCCGTSFVPIKTRSDIC